MSYLPVSPLRVARIALVAGLLGSSALVGLATAAPATAPQNAGLASHAMLPDFSDLVAKVKPAVVSITIKMVARPAADEDPAPAPGLRRGAPTPTPPNGRLAEARGSGFIVSADGFVVTNNHVVQDAKTVTVTLDDGRELPAKVIGRDPRSDVAVLKVEAATALPYLELAETTNVRPGEWVLAMGNPFGLGGTVTAGIVSARGRNIGAGPYDDFIQVDAPINHGNSGGPLFNQAGQVVGVNSAILSPSGGSIGIGFAIPSDMVSKVVAELETTGHVTRVLYRRRPLSPARQSQSKPRFYPLPYPEPQILQPEGEESKGWPTDQPCQITKSAATPCKKVFRENGFSKSHPF